MVNKAELRQFITQYFSDLELDELCFDYYPDLLNQFATGMTKSQKVIALISYCERRGLSDHLLVTLGKLRSAAYQEQFGLVPKRQAADQTTRRDPNRIFLSHANQDAAFARQLADDLRHNGFDIWMAPESIEPGEKWVDAIERGLETSGIFVLVITPHAADSKWVRDESNYAIALQNKDEMRLFTLLVGEGRIPPMWSVRQHISFREEYDEGLRQLLAALRPDRFAARPAPPPEVTPAPKAEPPTPATPAPAATELRCVNGHVMPAGRKFCGQCGQPAARPAGHASEPVVPNRIPVDPIVAPDPTPESAATKPSAGKPMYWALGVVALVAAALLVWQFTANGGGDGNENEVAGVTPPTQSVKGSGVGPKPTPTPTRPATQTSVPSRTPTPTRPATLTPVPSRTPTPTPTQTPTRPSAQAGDIRATSRGGVEVEQVFVPAGSFMMGSEDGSSDEQPVHEVALDAFWIDRTEVTNGQFAGCVADEACQPPSDTSSYTRDNYYGNDEFADYPVIYVSWNDASEFCEWAGGRLPTEAEWEYAARGPESFTYPWGNNGPSTSLLNFDGNVGDTSEVGSYPNGASWVGALDMAGNVREWVNDWYDSGYYGNSPGENPPGPASGEVRVLRGGAWNDDDARSSYRYHYVLPVFRFSVVGFRCAQE